MKKDIHPVYKEINVSCTCGNTFKTRSSYTKAAQLKIEICSKCHPFFTGKQKIVDTERRIDKFYSRYGTTQPAEAADQDNKIR